MKLLLRVPEACDAIGVGRSRLYELMSAGEIDSVRIGRNRLIPVASLEQYVSRLTALNGSENQQVDPRAACDRRCGSTARYGS